MSLGKCEASGNRLMKLGFNSNRLVVCKCSMYSAIKVLQHH